MDCNHALAFREKKWEMQCSMCKKVWGFSEIKEALDLLDRQPTLADLREAQETNFYLLLTILADIREVVDEMSKMQRGILERQVQKDRVVRSVQQERG